MSKTFLSLKSKLWPGSVFEETLGINDKLCSKHNKIDDPCSCNEKDFCRAFILLWWRHGWIGGSVPHIQGQGDKYYGWLLPTCHLKSGYQLKSDCFTPALWLQDMCYFKLNLQGPKVIYLCQNEGRMEFWETTINSLRM